VQRAAFSVLLVMLAGACAESVTNPTAVDAPDTLEVRCDGGSTEVLTPTVQARMDGVHAVIRNTSGHELLMQSDSHGEGVPPGETAVVLAILPGGSRFRCLEMSDDLDPGVEGGWADFDVFAPEGWVSPVLDCPHEGYVGYGDPAPDARGVEDPLADAERLFRKEGIATEAGYRTSDARTFINVKTSGVRESLTYTSDGHGGWLQTESSGC